MSAVPELKSARQGRVCIGQEGSRLHQQAGPLLPPAGNAALLLGQLPQQLLGVAGVVQGCDLQPSSNLQTAITFAVGTLARECGHTRARHVPDTFENQIDCLYHGLFSKFVMHRCGSSSSAMVEVNLQVEVSICSCNIPPL